MAVGDFQFTYADKNIAIFSCDVKKKYIMYQSIHLRTPIISAFDF